MADINDVTDDDALDWDTEQVKHSELRTATW